MTTTGVPIKVHPVSQLYGWLLAIGAVLVLTTPVGFPLLLVFALFAYVAMEDAISESKQLVARLEEHYGVSLSGWSKTKLILVVIGWSNRTAVGEVWSHDHSKRWDNTYVVVEGATARLVALVFTAQGQSEYLEVPSVARQSASETTPGSTSPPTTTPESGIAEQHDLRSPFAPPVAEDGPTVASEVSLTKDSSETQSS